jgi:hypothetical protein
MVTLSVLCPNCGERLRREVDEQVFPSSLRCRCGSRFSLRVEEEPPRSYLPEDLALSEDSDEAPKRLVESLRTQAR